MASAILISLGVAAIVNDIIVLGLERIVREKKIADDAATRAKEEAEAKAKADAEAAEKAITKAEALHKAQSETAERAKIEEIQRIKDEAEAKERVRIEAEQKAKDEETARIAAEVAKEKKRVENKKHREKIEDEIRTGICKLQVFTNKNDIDPIKSCSFPAANCPAIIAALTN